VSRPYKSSTFPTNKAPLPQAPICETLRMKVRLSCCATHSDIPQSYDALHLASILLSHAHQHDSYPGTSPTQRRGQDQRRRAMSPLTTVRVRVGPNRALWKAVLGSGQFSVVNAIYHRGSRPGQRCGMQPQPSGYHRKSHIRVMISCRTAVWLATEPGNLSTSRVRARLVHTFAAHYLR
jgi:hypothetical protein